MLSSRAQSDLANAGQFRHIVLPKFSADTVKANAAYLQNLHLRLTLSNSTLCLFTCCPLLVFREPARGRFVLKPNKHFMLH